MSLTCLQNVEKDLKQNYHLGTLNIGKNQQESFLFGSRYSELRVFDCRQKSKTSRPSLAAGFLLKR